LLIQLNPPLPPETSKAPGWAHSAIDYGAESALLWGVFMDADGACWTVPSAEVRMCANGTMERRRAEVGDQPAAASARGAAPTDGATLRVFSGATKPEGR